MGLAMTFWLMLKLLDAGVFNAIQDAGRRGYQAYGIPVSGAMDIFSFSAANALAQNNLNAAAIEIHSAITLETNAHALIALTGAEAILKINGRGLPQWTTVFVRGGSQIEIVPVRSGGWMYLAIHGSVEVPPILGSRSTYARAGFGRVLESGDEIKVGAQLVSDYATVAGRSIEARAQQFFNRDDVRVILGPHDDWFTHDAIETFLHESYYVTASADRMGYRLRGALLTRQRDGELISVGVPLGALQVPADGQPIALTAEHQTTGGYPIIATIIGADVPLIAQSVEGEPIRFRIVDMIESEKAWRGMWESFRV